MSDRDGAALLAGPAHELGELLRDGLLRFDVVQKHASRDGGHGGFLGRALGDGGLRRAAVEEVEAPLREHARDHAHDPRVSRRHGAHVVVHADGARHGREVVLERADDLGVGLGEQNDSRPGTHLRIARGLHGKVQEDFLAAAGEGARRGRAERDAREDGARDRLLPPGDALGRSRARYRDRR